LRLKRSGLFRGGRSEAEIPILRHQLNIQRRHVPKRVASSAMDRLVFGLYRLVPNAIRQAHPLETWLIDGQVAALAVDVGRSA